MQKIIDHTYPSYIKVWSRLKDDRFNGAYYYSQEIVKNIIPRINTDRKWFTVNCTTEPADHSIIFIHDNKNPTRTYSWIEHYKDVILVCGVPQTMDKVSHLGVPIYLPLSVDVRALQKYKTLKTKDCAYAGRWSKCKGCHIPSKCEYLHGMDRNRLLTEMAKFKKIYAVGRTAIEAKALGCEIGAYDPRFPDPSIWKVRDNLEMVPLLQKVIDDIDGKK